MSKKLFRSRGQSDAARGISPGFPSKAPTWAQEAYYRGYLDVLCARANRGIGQHINRMDADNFYSDPVELKTFDTFSYFLERDDEGDWHERT